MNILKFYRKAYIAVLLASLILFISCNGEELLVENNISATTLSKIHRSSIENFKKSKEAFYTKSTHSQIDENYIESIYLEKLNYLNQHGIKALIEDHNIDAEVLSEFDFYIENKTSSNIYIDLVDNFNFETTNEAEFLFTLVEVYNAVEQELNLNKNMNFTNTQLKSISWGCALAIAGTITVTIGAIFITGGASLLYFIFAKGLATATLIEACGDGWGEV